MEGCYTSGIGSNSQRFLFFGLISGCMELTVSMPLWYAPTPFFPVYMLMLVVAVVLARGKGTVEAGTFLEVLRSAW
jgi:hypothetical protein